MYEAFFGLKRRPFPSVPRTEHYFPGGAIQWARQTLARCIERAEGVGMLVGPSGTGKTLLCQLLAEHFGDSAEVVLLPSGRLSTRKALWQAILFGLGEPYRDMDEGELRLALVDHLTRDDRCTGGMVLLVDEAHTLPLRLLEEIRMLTNLVCQGEPRARLILSGSALLEERFASPKLESFSQRISARCYLESFNRTDTAHYVQAQIDGAGGQGEEVFPQDTCHAIYEATDGIPRLVNQVCDHALLLACTSGHPSVDRATIEEAWADLQQLPTPWNGDDPANAGQEVVIEFGGLDSDDENLDDEDDEAQCLPMLRVTDGSDEPEEPAERVEHIQEALADLDDDCQPSATALPEEEPVVEEDDNPFNEPFAEEEVIVDRFAAARSEQEAAPAVQTCVHDGPEYETSGPPNDDLQAGPAERAAEMEEAATPAPHSTLTDDGQEEPAQQPEDESQDSCAETAETRQEPAPVPQGTGADCGRRETDCQAEDRSEDSCPESEENEQESDPVPQDSGTDRAGEELDRRPEDESPAGPMETVQAVPPAPQAWEESPFAQSLETALADTGELTPDAGGSVDHQHWQASVHQTEAVQAYSGTFTERCAESEWVEPEPTQAMVGGVAVTAAPADGPVVEQAIQNVVPEGFPANEASIADPIHTNPWPELRQVEQLLEEISNDGTTQVDAVLETPGDYESVIAEADPVGPDSQSPAPSASAVDASDIDPGEKEFSGTEDSASAESTPADLETCNQACDQAPETVPMRPEILAESIPEPDLEHDDDDLIVVEEGYDCADTEALSSQTTPRVSRQEYRQLFARLRRGE